MHLIIILIIAIVVFGPQLWVSHVLRRHGGERRDFPGTGGEFAQHLNRSTGLKNYSVEKIDGPSGDHFNPETRQVALSNTHHDSRSLSAVVVAAHEVGHAIQHHIGYRPLTVRGHLARAAAIAERTASVLLIAMPFVSVVARTPLAGVALLVCGVAIMALPVAVHLITLPVEVDASFRRALPILQQGYLEPADLEAANKILLACALTYVSASLMGMFNFWRWIKILRRV